MPHPVPAAESEMAARRPEWQELGEGGTTTWVGGWDLRKVLLSHVKNFDFIPRVIRSHFKYLNRDKENWHFHFKKVTVV